MTWPPLETLLPAPRDDEPRSLREDLMDEVRDHLQSAYQGELLKTPDPIEAEKNVLARFGDPARVVRQLWFQAMREKIMSQRILVVTCLVMAVASIAGMGLMWNLNAQNQRATLDLVKQNHESTAKLVERLDESQQRLVSQFEEVIRNQKSSTNPIPSGMTPLKIRFSFDKKGGPPAVGCIFSLTQNQGKSVQNRSNLKVGPDGIIDFGPVEAGSYQLTGRLPLDQPFMPTFGQDIVIPYQAIPKPIEGELVCPSSNRQDVSFSLKVDWPKSLAKRNLWMACAFTPSKWEVGGRDWVIQKNYEFHAAEQTTGVGFFNIEDNLSQILTPPPRYWPPMPWVVIIDDKGAIRNLGLSAYNTGWGSALRLSPPILWGFSRSDLNTPENLNAADQLRPGGVVFDRSDRVELKSEVNQVTWPLGEVRLSSIQVFSAPHHRYGDFVIESGGLGENLIRRENILTAHDVLSERLEISKLPENDLLRTVEAKSGQENRLEIHVPQKLEEEVLHWQQVFVELHQEVESHRSEREIELNISRPEVDNDPVDTESQKTQQ